MYVRVGVNLYMGMSRGLWSDSCDLVKSAYGCFRSVAETQGWYKGLPSPKLRRKPRKALHIEDSSLSRGPNPLPRYFGAV